MVRAGIDRITTLDFLQAVIDAGKLYHSDYVVDGSASARKVVFRTGAKTVHMSAVLKAGLKTPITVIEGVTTTADGTALDRLNYDRDSPDNNTVCTVFHSSTFSGGKIIKSNQSGFGTTPGQAQSGDAGEVMFYKLKKNTDYAFDFTPASSADTVLLIIFYED